MDLIYKPRRNGKSTATMAWLMTDAQHRKIICPTEERAKVVRTAMRTQLVRAFGEEYGAKLAVDLKLETKIVRYGDFQGTAMDDVMIDDADELLQRLVAAAGANLAGATWTDDGARAQVQVPIPPQEPAAHWTPPENDPDATQSMDSVPVQDGAAPGDPSRAIVDLVTGTKPSRPEKS